MTTFAPSLSTAAPLLKPVIALNVWTLFMEGWLYATRIPAISQYNVKAGPSVDMAAEFKAKVPAHIRWKADNYNHLMEQPTQFYAIAIALAMLSPADETARKLAWGYVGLRVAHSLVQALVNRIMLRFGIFISSSAVLGVLTAKAAMLVF